MKDTIDVKKLRHKAEKPLNIISLVFSVAIYVLLTYYAAKALKDPETAEYIINFLGEDGAMYEPLLKYGVFFVIAALLVTYIVVIFKGLKNIGEAVAGDVPVSDIQFPRLADTCREYAEKLGIKNVPDVYVTSEGCSEIEFSSFTLDSECHLRLNCYYVLTAEESGDYTSINFQVARDLAHIALGHRSIPWVLLTIPARILPIYREMYMRAMNYSADRIAALLVGEENSAKAIVTLAQDPYFADIIDVDAYIKDVERISVKRNLVTGFYYNMTSDMPLTVYRIAALLDDKKKDGKLF